MLLKQIEKLTVSNEHQIDRRVIHQFIVQFCRHYDDVEIRKQMIESMVPILGLSIAQKEELGDLVEEPVEEEKEKNLEEKIEESQGLGSKFMNFLLSDS